jgi:hypothetical protein
MLISGNKKRKGNVTAKTESAAVVVLQALVGA